MSLQTSAVPLRINKPEFGRSTGPSRGQVGGQGPLKALGRVQQGGLDKGVVAQNRIEPANVRYTLLFKKNYNFHFFQKD